MANALLLFPPSWTMNTGSPHLALPLLQGFLRGRGIDVRVWDLNWHAAAEFTPPIPEASARAACQQLTLSSMNGPYFSAEDQFQHVASRFGGQWNAQLGFEFSDLPQRSTESLLCALHRESPFTEFFRNTVVPDIAANPPQLIGFSIAVAQQLVPALQLVNLVRGSGYDGCIVFGGNIVSRLMNELAASAVMELIDYLVPFQGEITLGALCSALIYGHPTSNVPHIMWRDGHGVQRNPSAPPLDLRTVPAPDYDGLPVGRYWGANCINIVAQRGCYHGRCTFCSIPYGWGDSGYAGERPAELVYRDMRELFEKHGIHRFKFVDEALSPRVAKRLATLILADDIKFEWEAYLRLEAAWYNESLVRMLAQAGLRKGYFGLEMMPSQERNLLLKNDSPDPERLLAIWPQLGIKIHFFCMFGYPGTNEADAKRTVEYILKRSNLIDTVDIFPWMYARHTAIPGVSTVVDVTANLDLELPYVPAPPKIMSKDAVVALASECEDLVWNEAPSMLHPTYRLVSPWD